MGTMRTDVKKGTWKIVGYRRPRGQARRPALRNRRLPPAVIVSARRNINPSRSCPVARTPDPARPRVIPVTGNPRIPRPGRHDRRGSRRHITRRHISGGDISGRRRIVAVSRNRRSNPYSNRDPRPCEEAASRQQQACNQFHLHFRFLLTPSIKAARMPENDPRKFNHLRWEDTVERRSSGALRPPTCRSAGRIHHP